MKPWILSKCWLGPKTREQTHRELEERRLVLPVAAIHSATELLLHLKNIHFPSLSTSIPHASASYNAVGAIVVVKWLTSFISS